MLSCVHALGEYLSREGTVGTLYYGDSRLPVPVEDRALAHLKVVIINKLRRGESFTFSWVKTRAEGHGRATIWLSPEISLHFEFDGSKSPVLNRRWPEELSLVASSGTGLVILEEPAEYSDPTGSMPTVALL